MKKCLRVCKKNKDSWLDLAGDTRLQAARSCSRARHARSWSVTLAGALQDKIGQLAVQLPRGWNSQLSQAARPSSEPALFWKTWLFTFHSHPSINTPFTHKRKRASSINTPWYKEWYTFLWYRKCSLDKQIVLESAKFNSSYYSFMKRQHMWHLIE